MSILKPLLFFSKRYLFSKSDNKAINIIVYIASLGVFFASAAFIIVLSGFSGIRTFNLNLLKLTDPDLVIRPEKGKFFKFNDDLNTILNEEKEIKSFSKTLEEKVFIDFRHKQKIGQLKGIDSNFYKVIPLDTTVFLGDIPRPDSNEVLVGVGMANELSLILSSGERPEVIKIMVPKPGKKLISNPRKAFLSKYFFPVGVYQTSSDHDKIYLYAPIEQTRQLLKLPPGMVSQIEIKASNAENIPLLKERLQKKLPAYKVLNRQELNPLIFKMLNTENLMTYFILLLILILAIFNIIGSLIMIIIDKKENIQTLKVLGMDLDDIKKIFLIQGVSMTMISGIAGLIFGLLLIFLQLHFPFLYIPQTSLAYPVEIHLSNIMAVLLTLFILGFLSAYIASKRIK